MQLGWRSESEVNTKRHEVLTQVLTFDAQCGESHVGAIAHYLRRKTLVRYFTLQRFDVVFG